MTDQIVSAGERCDASATDSECKGKERRSQLPVALSSLRYPTKPDARQLPMGQNAHAGEWTIVVGRDIIPRYGDDHLPKEFRTRHTLHRVIRMMSR